MKKPLALVEKRITAVIYARVSTDDQGDGASLESQLLRCRARALDLGAEVIHEFIDCGVSAFQGARPNFEASIALACSQHCAYFICWDSSRFARDHVVAGLKSRQLAAAGVCLETVSLQVDRSSPMGAAMGGIFAVMDEMVSRKIASDTARSMRTLVEQGFWVTGRAPYGFATYKRPGERNNRLQLNDLEASRVRQIFELRLRGVGSGTIAGTLNAQGSTFRGARWNKHKVLGVLTRSIVTGVLNYRSKHNKSDLFADYGVPIIAPSVFEQVQTLVRSAAPEVDTGSARSSHLLTGMMFCECGARFVTETAHGRSGSYSYYICGRWAKDHTICSHQRTRCDYLDKTIAHELVTRVLTPEAIEAVLEQVAVASGAWNKDRNERAKLLEAEIADHARKFKKLMTILEDQDVDGPGLAEIGNRMRELRGQIQTLERQLLGIRQEPDVLFSRPVSVPAFSSALRQILTDPANYKRVRIWLASFIKRVDYSRGTISLQYDPTQLVATAPVHSCLLWLPKRALLRTKTLTVDVRLAA